MNFLVLTEKSIFTRQALQNVYLKVIIFHIHFHVIIFHSRISFQRTHHNSNPIFLVFIVNYVDKVYQIFHTQSHPRVMSFQPCFYHLELLKQLKSLICRWKISTIVQFKCFLGAKCIETVVPDSIKFETSSSKWLCISSSVKGSTDTGESGRQTWI